MKKIAFLCIAALGVACTTAPSEITESDPLPLRAEPPPALRASDVPAPVCNPADAIDATQFPHRPAKKVPGACTAENVADFVGYLQTHKTATFADLTAYAAAQYTADCNSCMFAPASEETWSPILVSKTGELASVNVSGCVEIVSASAACGKAHRQWTECLEQGCAGCQPDELSSCYGSVQTGACMAATQSIVDACGRDVGFYLESCRSVDAWITKQCVTGG